MGIIEEIKKKTCQTGRIVRGGAGMARRASCTDQWVSAMQGEGAKRIASKGEKPQKKIVKGGSASKFTFQGSLRLGIE